MTKDELSAIIDAEIANSVGYFAGRLAEQRKTAMERYYGEPYGDEIEGRSQYVGRDIADTIEWIMPSLMKIFMSSDEIVRFEPQNQEDEAGAKQATDYLNYLFQRRNPGFVILYTWFKDALLCKNGFIKVYWEDKKRVRKESYKGLSMDEAALIMQNMQAEGVEVEVERAEQGDSGLSVVLKLTTSSGTICIEPVPPEEVLVSKNAGWDLQACRFVAHRTKKSVSDLREMGLDVDELDWSDDDAADYNLERQTRFLYDQEDVVVRDVEIDEASREVWLTEAYPLVDYDGDGIAERRLVLKVGKNILRYTSGGEANYEIDRVPLETLTPIMVPHKLFGLSISDLIVDLDYLKSTFVRQIVDNMRLTNNTRMMVLDGMANIDDLLTVRPGGVVRVKTFDAVKPIPTPFFGAPAFNFLGYIDQIREGRTGTRYFQGVNADALNQDVSGAALDSFRAAAMDRIELIARIFADTGVKSMFWSMFGLVQKHDRKASVIRLRGEWVNVDPREWQTRYDMTATVGLGTGSKQQLINAAQLLGKYQQEIAKGGMFGRVVTEQNVFNLANAISEAVWPKKGGMFFSDPSQLPPPQPQPDQKVEASLEKARMADATKRDLAAVELLKAAYSGQAENLRMQAERTNQVDDDAKSREHEMAMRKLEPGVQQAMDEAKFMDAMGALVQALRQSQETIAQSQEAVVMTMQQISEALSAPKELVRDANGRAVGVRTVTSLGADNGLH